LQSHYSRKAFLKTDSKPQFCAHPLPFCGKTSKLDILRNLRELLYKFAIEYLKNSNFDTN